MFIIFDLYAADIQGFHQERSAPQTMRDVSCPQRPESRDIQGPHQCHQVAPDVYAGEARYPNGTPVYFGWEKVTDTNFVNWFRYGQWTGGMALKYSRIAEAIRDNDDKKLAYNDANDNIRGFSKEEYENLLTLMNSRDINKTIQVLSNIRDGITGFDLKHGGNFYVAYASKVPVHSLFKFLQILSDTCFSPETYKVAYENILMTVRSKNLPRTPMYENRGITRNPLVIPQGGYPNLALSLHRFTALCAQEVFLGEKLYMQVSPISRMQEILIRGFGANELFIGYNDRGHPKYPNYKALFHKGKDGILRLAREGVEMSADQELLPEQIQFESKEGAELSTQTNGCFEIVNLVKISALTKQN